MPLYFFLVHDEEQLDDADGVELPDLATARREALRFAGELLPGLGGELRGGRTWSLEARDAEGSPFTISVSVGAVQPT